MISSKKKPGCICAGCPSYDNCSGRNQLGFCLGGKSACIIKESGCICMACPVQKEHNFDKIYYCIYGSYKGQTKNKDKK